MALSALESGNYFDAGFAEHAQSLGVQMRRVPNPRVVLVASQALTPFGDLNQTWEAFKEGRSAARAYPAAENAWTNVAAPLPVPPSEVFAHLYGPKDQKRMGEAAILADGLSRTLVKGLDLLNENGELIDKIDRRRFGLWIGSGIGDATELADVEKAINSAETRVKGSRRINPNSGLKLFPQGLIGFLSRKLKSQGPSGGIPAACATGAYNWGQLFMLIKNGYLDAGIAGGVEYAVNSHPGLAIGVFAMNRATSRRNDDPETASRPFDADRDGFVPGSGGAVSFLTSEEFAHQHGLPIVGEVVGSVNTIDAFEVTNMEPENVARTYAQALFDEENQVFYRPDVIGAHATSTIEGDPDEASAIRLAFGDKASEIAVTAIKGSATHLMGAIGALNNAIVEKIFEENIVPHTANLKTVDPEVAKHNLDLVMGKPRHMEVVVYEAGAFGFDNYTNGTAIVRYAA
ncbi:MAG: beta-ketoacyl synthase N-terminal-like domain-containing protein [bacterium]|nr:beta-ketoacyl synthase N-terminal-like domain-containing protein [bacterium]